MIKSGNLHLMAFEGRKMIFTTATLMKIYISTLIIAISGILALSCTQPTTPPADLVLQVQLNSKKGPMDPVWAWFGYDEPNYTYMEHGKKLLSEIAEVSPVPVYVRAHNLLTTGDGTPALKWGSTNAYTEDRQGNPVYHWEIVDSIFDTYVERGMRPLVEVGFMPEALSSKPQPYKHQWRPGAEYSDIYTGWSYPPANYEKWGELVYQWVIHCVDRYGKEEVEQWFWEPWNEPNIGYWQGTTEEYIKLYDYTAHAVKRALPNAIFGGPHTTGPSWDEAEQFLRAFLDHVVGGTNYVTGETGTPLDFIAYHAKGRPTLQGDTVVLMNLGTHLRDISKGFEIVASYPSLKDLPIVIGESDPEGCAACSVEDYPANAYRNGTLYSSYTAAAFARKFDLADHFGINFLGAVTWAFEFENEPWFHGYRALATNGVNKPVLNVFRMFGMMSGERVEVTGDLAYDYLAVRDSSVRGDKPDINALAAVDGNKAMIMVWNYHDLDLLQPASNVDLQVMGIGAPNVSIDHYRVDQQHSNSYQLWLHMGSPQEVTTEQYTQLEAAGKLEQVTSKESIAVTNNELTIPVTMESQAVSLFVIEW